MHSVQLLDGLGFHDHGVIYQKVEAVGLGNQEPLEGDVEGRFKRHAMPSPAQGVGEAEPVGLLKETGSQSLLDADGRGQDGLGKSGTERVNDFETDCGLSSGAAPTAAESRRDHGNRLRVSHSPLENPAGFPHLTAAGGNHHAIFSFSNDLGRLIQAGPGSAGGFGRPFGKRSGWSWYARSSTPCRAS